VPSTWMQMKPGERFTKVELDADSEEYKGVEQSVRATCQTTVKQIVKVFSSVVIVHCIHHHMLQFFYSFVIIQLV